MFHVSLLFRLNSVTRFCHVRKLQLATLYQVDEVLSYDSCMRFGINSVPKMTYEDRPRIRQPLKDAERDRIRARWFVQPGRIDPENFDGWVA